MSESKRWSREMRLRRPQEYRRVWEEGRSWAHPLLVLWAAPSRLPQVRIGFTASRKVGNAVVRNRARRLLREAARQSYRDIAVGWDLVLVARKSIATAKAQHVAAALDETLRRARLLT